MPEYTLAVTSAKALVLAVRRDGVTIALKTIVPPQRDDFGNPEVKRTPAVNGDTYFELTGKTVNGATYTIWVNVLHDSKKVTFSHKIYTDEGFIRFL